MEKITIFGSHVPEHLLEEYAFGRLSDVQRATIEEHLLICHTCQDRLKETDDYILLFKRAARASLPRKPAAMHALRHSPILAIVAVGMIAAAVALAIAFPDSWRAPGPPQRVELTAFRGGPAELPRAHNGDVEIVIDASNLDETRDMQIEVVDTFGNRVWANPAPKASDHGKIEARVGARLSRGVYWVRLYLPQRELVREFGLRVE